MKYLIQKVIELYWQLIEPSRRRRCVFRESCSAHVHRVTRDQGAIEGVLALFRRMRRCRNGYVVRFDEHLNPSLVLAYGTWITPDEASDRILAILSGAVDVIRSHQSAARRTGPKYFQ